MNAIRNGRAIIIILALCFVVLYVYLVRLKYDKVYEIPKQLQKYLIYRELPDSAENKVNSLKIKINELNVRREVRNWQNFGPPVKDTVTIVVQVHRDIRELQYLIISLAQVRYIESALLIFSHSYYSEHINRLIRDIDFCNVMQIFFPNSVQLHPDDFPGIDPDDCSDDGQTAQSCRRRDARSAERKHHWWWKANFIFDRMQWSARYTGTVIFLEEDHFVAPDLLHMLQLGQRVLPHFPDVEVMSLGSMFSKNLHPYLLTLENWRPPFHVGVAFNKTTWKKIVELSSFYCMYDDCSWSYSLLNVFKNFPSGDVHAVACAAPRVVATSQFDDPDRAFLDLSKIFSDLKLFPEKVSTVFQFGPNGRVYAKCEAPPRGNGGWASIKDQLLCLDPLTALTAESSEETIASRLDQYTE